jgi:hypothetical protein
MFACGLVAILLLVYALYSLVMGIKSLVDGNEGFTGERVVNPTCTHKFNKKLNIVSRK